MLTMARSRLCRCCREFHDLAQPWPQMCAGHFGESEATGLYLISDSMEPIRSMADGKMYDSKSRYRGDLKARGLIEVGNERVERRPSAPPPVKQHLKQALDQLRG